MKKNNKSKIKQKLTPKKAPNFKFESEIYLIQKLFLLNFVIVALGLLITLIISLVYTPSPPDVSVLPPWAVTVVRPKPFEWLGFLISLFSVSIFSLIYILFKPKPYIAPKINWLFSLVIVILFFITFCFMDIFNMPFEAENKYYFINVILSGVGILNIYPVATIIFTWLFTLFFCYRLYNKSAIDYKRNDRFIDKLVLPMLLIAAVYIIVSWRIYSISGIDRSWQYSVHLDVVMYPLSQVARGKVLLEDLYSQYGLFPEIIYPVFKLVQLNVLNFTVLMAILQFIGLAALLWVLNKTIHNKLILFLGGITLIVLTCENHTYFDGYPERYFQYSPIRFLWPALSVYMYYLLCKRNKILYTIIFSVISAIAVLWNLDTGVFIFLAYIICLFLTVTIRIFSHKSNSLPEYKIILKEALTKLVLYIITMAVVISLFFTYLKLRSGGEIHISWLVTYPQIFSKLGFNLLPMPKVPNPWMAVLGVYLFGFISSLLGLVKVKSLRNEILLYISILGIGLFSYYTGRSHVYNLYKVVWPSVIVAVMLTDSMLRSIKLKLISLSNILLPSFFVALMVLLNMVYIINIPNEFNNLYTAIQTYNQPDDPIVADELAFIKAHLPRNQECLLLTARSGIYASELGILSPIQGPGMTASLLMEDLNNFIWMFQNHPPQCVFWGYDWKSSPEMRLNFKSLLSTYRVVDVNSHKTMMFLVPN